MGKGPNGAKNGVDLVVELPVYYSVQSAEFFAKGAIESLNALGVDCVSFGVTCNDLDKLKEIAKIIQNNSSEYQAKLRAELKKGHSFPVARGRAVGEEYSDILKSPNNILAIEYIKAGAKNPLPIKRIGAEHDEDGVCNQFASASYIRKLLFSGNYNKAKGLMPQSSFEVYIREMEKGRAPVSLKALDKMVIANLRKKMQVTCAK